MSFVYVAESGAFVKLHGGRVLIEKEGRRIMELPKNTLDGNEGLHPYFGFLHAWKEHHPALVSDLLEEWRPVQVDSLVMSLIRLFLRQNLNNAL